MSRLRLRPVGENDEAAVLTAHEQLVADHFEFALGHRPGMAWDAYIRQLDDQAHGRHLAEGHVPASFLLAEVDGRVVGRTSIRHQLNEALVREFGHIGYAVLPAERRRGYATEILRQSLVIARGVGVEQALVICDVDNIGSARTIERCGGVFEAEAINSEGTPIRRYWVPTSSVGKA
jgi:predicted acetyltransferase